MTGWESIWGVVPPAGMIPVESRPSVDHPDQYRDGSWISLLSFCSSINPLFSLPMIGSIATVKNGPVTREVSW